MAGLFSSATLEQIRGASDIVEVVGAYLPLKRAGANFVALCPFHKEKTPSFNVNPQRQVFHCFGCHKGGDVFAFVQEYENITFGEAVRRLAERAHIPLEFEDDPGRRERRFLKEALLQIHEAITQRWQAALANEAAGEIARQYLRTRQVPEAAIKLFRLGYAPDAWDDTVNWAKGKGYEPALMEQAGLIIRKEGTDRHYDRFRGRLMFPISDEQGRVIGFSGRVLSGDEKTAKYVNSPETPLFTKGRIFYGLDKARRPMLDAGSAVICEGQLDLIACHLAGIQNVVAPQGTAFTADHARILKRHVDQVVLCFDSDSAGQAASVRVLDDLLASGLAVRVATLPVPHDPDSFIREFGAAKFQELLGQARDFFDFYLDHLCTAHDVATDQGVRAVVQAMAQSVRKSGDLVLLDKYAQKTAMKLAVDLKLPVAPDAVRAEFRKAGLARGPEAAAASAGESAPEAPPRPSTPEFWLLKLLLLDHALLDWAAARLDLAWIQHPVVRQVVASRLERHARGLDDVTALLTELTESAARSLVSEAMAERREIPNRPQQLADIVRRLRDQFVDRQLAALTLRLNQPDLPDAARVELLQQQQALRESKRESLPK